MPLGARGVKYSVRLSVLTPGTEAFCFVKELPYVVPALPEPKVGKPVELECPHCGLTIYYAWNNGGDSWGSGWIAGCQIPAVGSVES
jgi:hypothetical protein